jgi:hypothetical protein
MRGTRSSNPPPSSGESANHRFRWDYGIAAGARFVGPRVQPTSTAPICASMARELAPRNIHVAHLIIDGAIDSEAIHRRLSAATGEMPDLSPDSLIQTSSVAEAYWALHNQSRNGWTHELDLRPYGERW